MRRTTPRALALAGMGLALLLTAPTPRTGAAQGDALPPGPDMRILTTPADVLFRVELAPGKRRFAPGSVHGAMGWSARIAPATPGVDATWPTPATDGVRVFVGGRLSDSEFYALSADTGRLAWKTSLSDNGPTPAVVRDRHVYFNTQSCTLYAYDARSGSRTWSRYLAGHLESIPAVDGGIVATTRPSRHGVRADKGGGRPALTILNHAGRVVADVDVDAEAVGAPVLAKGSAYLSTRQGTLYCVDTGSGEERWSRACEARGTPWVDETGVYVATRDALASFNPRTGAARWNGAAITPSSGSRHVRVSATPPALRVASAASNRTDAFWGEGLRPVAVRGRIAIAEGRTLRMFERVSGAELAWWEIDVDDPFLGPPLVCGDTLIVATRGGQIRGVDTRNGEITFGVDLDRPLGSGVIADDGHVCGVTRDGIVFRVHTGDMRADGWPMWGGTPSHAGSAAPSGD